MHQVQELIMKDVCHLLTLTLTQDLDSDSEFVLLFGLGRRACYGSENLLFPPSTSSFLVLLLCGQRRAPKLRISHHLLARSLAPRLPTHHNPFRLLEVGPENRTKETGRPNHGPVHGLHVHVNVQDSGWDIVFIVLLEFPVHVLVI